MLNMALRALSNGCVGRMWLMGMVGKLRNVRVVPQPGTTLTDTHLPAGFPDSQAPPGGSLQRPL
jgi:hypothetical protein